MSDNPKVVSEYPRMVDKHETWTESGPVLSHLPDREIALLRERTLTTIAEPSPLALWGFATGTWMAATVLGGYLPVAYGFAVAPTLLFFAGLPQFIGGMYAFRRGHTLDATAFTCFGAFNFVVGVMLLLGYVGVVRAGAGYHEMFGFLLESFAFISFGLMAAAISRNFTLVAVLGFLGLGYALSGIGQFLALPAAAAAAQGGAASGAPAAGGPGDVAAAGGACLLAASLFAYYLGLATLVNSSWNRKLMPILGEP